MQINVKDFKITIELDGYKDILRKEYTDGMLLCNDLVKVVAESLYDGDNEDNIIHVASSLGFVFRKSD